MKNSRLRLLSMVLCIAMLFGVLSGTASAELSGITGVVPTDEYTFFDFEDFKQMCQDAAVFEETMICVYTGYVDFVIEESLTIPETVTLRTDSAGIRVAQGATVQLDGVMEAGRIAVDGSVIVSDYGYMGVDEALEVTGSITVFGTLAMGNGMSTGLTGAERINYGPNGTMMWQCYYDSESALQQIFNTAKTAPANWSYITYNSVSALSLTDSLTVPANCILTILETPLAVTAPAGCGLILEGSIEAYAALELQCGLTVQESGFVYLEVPMSVADTLVNRGTVYICRYGDEVAGSLNLAGVGAYDDGQENGGRIIVDSSDANALSSALLGPDLSSFTTTYLGDGVNHGWELTDYNYVVDTPEDPTDPVEPSDPEEPSDPVEPSEPVDPPAEPIETIAMHRLYNPNSGEHFYTGSLNERDNLISVGWNYEGIAWNAPTKTGANVYRLFNPNNGDHHYTMSQEEVDNLVAVGWIYEGVCWNSAPAEGNIPMYRLFNPNVGTNAGGHHYTGSEEERDNLVAVGWIYEGIGWYGIE